MMTQGAFSFLPGLSADEIQTQIGRAIRMGWTVSIEHTEQPAPGNHLWDMWGLPSFDEPDPNEIMAEIDRCRATFPGDFVKVDALDTAALGRPTIALSFIIQRPLDRA
jgi:ribulose-bisphosphate carboxylase small chain